jgi:hypothetical protein
MKLAAGVNATSFVIALAINCLIAKCGLDLLQYKRDILSEEDRTALFKIIARWDKWVRVEMRHLVDIVRLAGFVPAAATAAIGGAVAAVAKPPSFAATVRQVAGILPGPIAASLKYQAATGTLLFGAFSAYIGTITPQIVPYYQRVIYLAQRSTIPKGLFTSNAGSGNALMFAHISGTLLMGAASLLTIAGAGFAGVAIQALSRPGAAMVVDASDVRPAPGVPLNIKVVGANNGRFSPFYTPVEPPAVISAPAENGWVAGRSSSIINIKVVGANNGRFSPFYTPVEPLDAIGVPADNRRPAANPFAVIVAKKRRGSFSRGGPNPKRPRIGKSPPRIGLANQQQKKPPCNMLCQAEKKPGLMQVINKLINPFANGPRVLNIPCRLTGPALVRDYKVKRGDTVIMDGVKYVIIKWGKRLVARRVV